MSALTWQIGFLIMIFLLVVFLGLQIQISGLYKSVEELQKKLDSFMDR